MLYYTEKAATVAIVFLMTIAICSTTIQEVKTNFVQNKLLSTSYATKQPSSQLYCVQLCSRDKQFGKCRIAGYNKSSKECKLSMDYPHTLLNVDDARNGVFFYGKRYILLLIKKKIEVLSESALRIINNC